MNNEWISGDDAFSAESSFRGESETKDELERLTAAYNPKHYWDIVQWNVQCMAADAAQKLPQATEHKQEDNRLVSLTRVPKSRTQSDPPAKPYNPYEGDLSAKQLSETMDEFLLRLPPSTSNLASSGPWLWIANPYSPRRVTNEDVAGFKQTGSRALADFLLYQSDLEVQYPNKASSAMTRMLKPARDFLEARILELAQRHGVTCGKWMLFPSEAEVDGVWKTVAHAVVNRQLGCAARVATNDGGPNRKQRLLCVYTADFSDIQDVKMVLNNMRRLGLVKDSKAHSIYYKCDAYTYLDIVNGNEYKLRASMYKSQDLLSETNTT